jgi:hypothetical protein
MFAATAADKIHMVVNRRENSGVFLGFIRPGTDPGDAS